MQEHEALSKMVAPGTRRPGKYREGVIQIHVTRACDMACYNCTQGSNYAGVTSFITTEQFEEAVMSLRGYFGVVGVFGGNPALHPQFDKLCEILREYVPFNQRGLWCNHPAGKGKVMRETFDPSVSNLNVHLNEEAYHEFKRDWPESNPVGLVVDSRHSPVFVAMKDVVNTVCPRCPSPRHINTQGGEVTCPVCGGSGYMYDEAKAWELIADCDINKHWSAMIGVFRGELRAWFCEIAGAQAMLHQAEPDYPDTGIKIISGFGTDGLSDFDLGDGKGVRTQWWRMGMEHFAVQVRKHCHECGVPLRGYGELAQAHNGKEQCSATHKDVARPKRKGRAVELVTIPEQLQQGRINRVTDYIGNSKR